MFKVRQYSCIGSYCVPVISHGFGLGSGINVENTMKRPICYRLQFHTFDILKAETGEKR